LFVVSLSSDRLVSRSSALRRAALASCASALLLTGVASPRPAAARTAAAPITLTGAGSTFVFPFFNKAFFVYSKAHPDVRVNYQPIGSGGGIQQFTKKTVDFGASDVPMNPTELKAAEAAGGPVLQFPVALGAEAIVYNLPSVNGYVKISRAVLAGIYLGKITSWDDAALAKDNAELKLPKLPIAVVHRSDGSGTTYIFTDYLSTVSADWKSAVGTGKSVQWPAGVGGKGNAGVAAQVRNTPGAIGYVELAYAIQNKMAHAQVQSRGGSFVYPTLATTRNAAATLPNVDATHFSIVNATGAQSYPIVGYSWALVYQKPRDAARSKALVQVMTWVVSEGQKYAGDLQYVPLPASIQKAAQQTIAKVGV